MLALRQAMVASIARRVRGRRVAVQYDYIIVGAGIYGATYARLARDKGYKVLVIDKRGHVGGLCYTERIEGIMVHRYGAHIFHTSNKAVWDFVNRYSPFNHYINCPIAKYDNKLYHLPFNMNTFYAMWGVTTPKEAKAKVDEERMAALKALGGREPRNIEEQALCLVGRSIYETLIKGYTQKQWGRECSKLPAFIIRRLPLRWTFNNNYFNDTYQGIPIGGYTKLIQKLLTGVELRLNTEYIKERGKLRGLTEKVVYTGGLDEYFDYRLGCLQYRSVRFEDELFPMEDYQGNAVVNYTSAQVPYTRIIEHKHFSAEDAGYKLAHTIISREYSSEWVKGAEPCYPINDEANTALYAQYKEACRGEKGVVFGGRLAQYRYYDMTDAIAKAFSDFAREEHTTV